MDSLNRCHFLSILTALSKCFHPLLSQLSKILHPALGTSLYLSFSMEVIHNGQRFSKYEARLACALQLYCALNEETISSIISTLREGLGSQPIPCGLVTALQQSSHPFYHYVYLAVYNNRAHWEPEAREVYRRWWDLHSQAVQRYQIPTQRFLQTSLYEKFKGHLISEGS